MRPPAAIGRFEQVEPPAGAGAGDGGDAGGDGQLTKQVVGIDLAWARRIGDQLQDPDPEVAENLDQVNYLAPCRQPRRHRPVVGCPVVAGPRARETKRPGS